MLFFDQTNMLSSDVGQPAYSSILIPEAPLTGTQRASIALTITFCSLVEPKYGGAKSQGAIVSPHLGMACLIRAEHADSQTLCMALV